MFGRCGTTQRLCSIRYETRCLAANCCVTPECFVLRSSCHRTCRRSNERNGNEKRCGLRAREAAQSREIERRGLAIRIPRPIAQRLTEQSCCIERQLVAHDVVASARDFVRQCFHGDDRIALRGFLLVEALRRRQELCCEVCRLEERPGQVGLPFFTLPSPWI